MFGHSDWASCRMAAHQVPKNVRIKSIGGCYQSDGSPCRSVKSFPVRNAGGGMAAVVAMTSDTLDLSESNATCRIYSKYGETSVFFRHVNMDKVGSVADPSLVD